jgi:hypothetical protein
MGKKYTKKYSTKTALFWVTTHQVLVNPYPNLSRNVDKKLPILAANYPEERSSNLLGGGSLKTLKHTKHKVSHFHFFFAQNVLFSAPSYFGHKIWLSSGSCKLH